MPLWFFVDAKLQGFDAPCKGFSPKWVRKIPNRDGYFPLFCYSYDLPKEDTK